MNNTNGCHASMPDHQKNDLPSTNDNTTIAPRKRLKPKHVASATINEKRLAKKHNTMDSNNNSRHKLNQSSPQLLCAQPISYKETSSAQTYPFEHIPSFTRHNETHFSDSCDNDHDQMVSCNRCSTTVHLRRSNLLVSTGDPPKRPYICEKCRAISVTTRDKLIQPFLFDPKKNLSLNRFKSQSTSGQIQLSTAANDRPAEQLLDELKSTVAHHHQNEPVSSSSSSLNLKRKRLDSSTPCSSVHPPTIPNTQLDLLHRLCLSCQPEAFRCPSSSFHHENDLQKDSFSQQQHCFICRKSLKHGPSLKCDYCPLIYHLDCLTPPMTSLPLSTDKWMCSNHFEPTFDRYFLKKTTCRMSKRVKIYHQYSAAEPNVFIQEFTQFKRPKNDLLSNTINNSRLQRIDISQIPKYIEDYYSKTNAQDKPFDQYEEQQNERSLQTCPSTHEPSSAYDPYIWDILQDILHHISDDQVYKLTSIDHRAQLTKPETIETCLLKKKCTTLDRLDTLLTALNEPNVTLQSCTIKNNISVDDLVTTTDTISSSNETQNILPLPLNDCFSLMIDISQFRLSHAALIHLHSKQVIYLRKQVIWFGSSALNDICLNHSPTCPYVTERHACLYYDGKRNSFELLNYSEYGTIVNGLRYGLETILNTHDDARTFDGNQEEQFENENLQRCSCLPERFCRSAWDGAAQIEQGTVIKIGCHELLFYRHVVR